MVVAGQHEVPVLRRQNVQLGPQDLVVPLEVVHPPREFLHLPLEIPDPAHTKVRKAGKKGRGVNDEA